ncbi:MAG: RNB domain-containing ribonuclease [Myxococcota bacterium]
MLVHLRQASQRLRQHRTARGWLDLDVPESQVVVNGEGVAQTIKKRLRWDAHKLIEDLMIAANEAVAEMLQKAEQSTLYRVHPTPKLSDLQPLLAFADRMSIPVDISEPVTPTQVNRLLKSLHTSPLRSVGDILLLRSLPVAQYSEFNLGHFGLGSSAYLHFTSPIRRYPDLLVHRSLYRLWTGQSSSAQHSKLAAHTSRCERRAVTAERQVEQLMACHVAVRHLGEVFRATVSGVVASGVFVRIEEPYLEGMLPVAALGMAGGDYYDYVTEEMAFYGRTSGHRVGLGDEVLVKLARVDPRLRRIDFVLESESRSRKRPSGRASSKKRRGSRKSRG